jgi:hypothetical protein
MKMTLKGDAMARIIRDLADGQAPLEKISRREYHQTQHGSPSNTSWISYQGYNASPATRTVVHASSQIMRSSRWSYENVKPGNPGRSFDLSAAHGKETRASRSLLLKLRLAGITIQGSKCLLKVNKDIQSLEL